MLFILKERRKSMLYIFDKDDNFKNIITEDTGLIDTRFKDYQNHLIDEPFVFHVDSESELLPLIVAENQVAFKHTFNALQQDVEMLKLMRIKEIDEIYNSDGYIVRVQCEPSWLELYDHFIEDRRIENGTAQTAMNRALQGSRWTGVVSGEFGNGSTNFYWIDAVEALFKIVEEWGGTLQDYITLDENNEIATRIMYLLPRLGRDNGLLIQPGYNAEAIERRTLSYPVTAIWGQGASLEIEDEQGEHTGGYTRYITFEDVEWSKAKGDPVDKPKGQKWVGDPDALAKYGYLKEDGSRIHRFSHFSNQDYETPEELLWATWEALQKEKEPEVYHEAVIDEVDKPIFLGDTGTILDRHYGKPIEVQSQITGLEYDILRPTVNVNIVLGNYKDMSRDPLEDEIDEIKKEQSRPSIINDNSFPDVKPGTPVNVEAVGMFRAILVSWEYDSKIYISHYEVYASQTADFVPDAQFLVYRGRVSSYGHEVGSNETWYYRVRAVNTHGTTSDFSVEVSASSTRIDFIDLEDEIKQEIQDTKDRTEEAYGNANIAAGNAAEAIGIAQEGFDAAQESLLQSKDALQGLQSVFDELEPIHAFVDDTGNQLTTIKTDVIGLQTEVGNKVDQTVYNSKMTQLDSLIQTKVSQIDADNRYTQQTTFDQFADRFSQRVEEIEGWEFGGRNLVKNSRGDTLTGWSRWRTTDTRIFEFQGSDWIKVNRVDNAIVGIHTPVFDMKANRKYTISFTFRSYSNSGYDLNYIYLRQNQTGTTTIKKLPDVYMGSNSGFVGDLAGDGLRVWFTFEHNEDIDEARLLLAINGRPENAGFIIKELQIEEGNKVTPWSPAIEDYDKKFSAINQTVSDIATRVQETEDDYSALSQTVLGFQTTVSNMEGDLNIVTNLANANQQSITNVDGKVNTLTQTVNATVSRIENGDTNLVTHDANNWETGSISTVGGGNTASTDSQYLRLIDYYPIESNREYTLTTYAGLLNGYETSYRINIYYYDATKNFIEFRSISFNTPVTATTPTNAKYYRIRVSNFEMGGLPWFIEPNFMGSAIRIKLQRGAYSTDWTNHDSDVYSQYSQLQDAINLRVTKDNLISQINLDTSGVLISGKKLVLDGDTTVTGNFRVNSANIASIEAGKIVGGEADFAKFSAININANSINSGTLSTDVMRVRGGSTTEYALIDGSEITTRGKYTRTWFGETQTHDVGIQLRYGRLRFHNYGNRRNLYFSDLGISTYFGGSDNEEGETSSNYGSGTIEFFSYRHNSTIRGLTMYSNNGVVALESEQRNIVIAPRYSTYSSGSKFSFDVKSTGDGYVTFGNSGIRIQRDGNSVIYATNGNGDLASGSFYGQSLYGDLKPRGKYAYVRAPRLRIINHDTASTSNFGDLEGQQFMAGSIRLNLQLGNNNFYIGTSSGEVRITNNLLWQGSHASTTYRPVRARSFIESSSRTFKTDIKAYEDSAMDVIRSLTVVNYRFKDDVERGVNLQQIGFISEDSPAIATADNMAIQTTKLASYLTKGVQELDLKIDLTREELVLKIAKLEQIINKLESVA